MKRLIAVALVMLMLSNLTACSTQQAVSGARTIIDSAGD